MTKNVETIVLGGGCFWCTEAVFLRVKGIGAVESGYANGHTPAPTYEQVCTGLTGHCEVVKVTFHCDQITLDQVLNIFFSIHDPTTLNRQGNDTGTQYRSGIYATSEDQKSAVQAFIAQLTVDQRFDAPIVTEVALLDSYTRAEDSHQNYFAKHPHQGYCSFVIGPKLKKFKASFHQLTKP